MYNENSRGPRTDPCGTPYFFLYNMSLLSFYKVYKKLNIFPPTLPPAEKINN